MQLRPRQKIFVDRCVKALEEKGNTLGVAIVGFGKTIAMSGVIQALFGTSKKRKILVLQHRTELKEQNSEKFKLFTKKKFRCSYFQGETKSTVGRVVFGMVQTVVRNLHLLPKFHAVCIDEAHHITSPSYMQIIEHLKKMNPELLVFGVTATPQRGDGQGLGKVFTNIADIVSVEETIQSGHLVRPRTFQIDLGVSGLLSNVSKTSSGEYNPEEVAEILNAVDINTGVLKHWKEMASDRKTIAFCSTVDHARELASLFENGGVKCALIHGGLSDKERKEQLDYYENGEAMVCFNVAVLTEGYDYQPTSCVMLLRQSSFYSTMVQMIGRGLRVVDSNIFPDVIKTDCLVLDFGLTTSFHGSLEASVDLRDKKSMSSETDDESITTKFCPECLAEIPIRSSKCPLCGFEFKRIEILREELKLPADFSMIEVNLMDKSNFLFEGFAHGTMFVASGFDAFAVVCQKNDNEWVALGGRDGMKMSKIATSTRQVCLSCANDFLNKYEGSRKSTKGNQWLKKMMTPKQKELVSRYSKTDFSDMSRYRATCFLTYQFNKRLIKNLVL